MIKMQATDAGKELNAWLKMLGIVAKSGEFKRALSGALKIGLKAVEKRAKTLAKPKRKQRKRKGFTPPPKRTGMLRKSYSVKNGVSRKGKGGAYAVLGPKKALSKMIDIGGRSVLVKPSKYAHLVEFGFMAKHRRKRKSHSILGHKVEFFRPNRPRRGSLLHTLNQFSKGANRLTNGKLFKVWASVLTMSGKGATWVPGQYILTRAYKESSEQMKTAIMDRMTIEAQKLFSKITKRNAKKAGG